jgi:hypothetical protein
MSGRHRLVVRGDSLVLPADDVCCAEGQGWGVYTCIHFRHDDGMTGGTPRMVGVVFGPSAVGATGIEPVEVGD